MKTPVRLLFLATVLATSQASFADGPFAGQLAAGTASFAPTDVYRLTCPVGTASVRARATNPDGNTADEIAVQIIAPSRLARSAISLEGVPPPTVIRTGGPGIYLVTVHKDSTLLTARYSLTVDCYGVTTPIPNNQTVLIQNQ